MGNCSGWTRAAAVGLALALLGVSAGACGTADRPATSTAAAEAPERGTSTVTFPGVSAVIPPGWQATPKPVSGLLQPRQLLTAGSFDLSPGGGPPSRTGNCTPAGVLKSMPNDGALVVVTRYARDALSLQRLHDLPARPARLRLSPRDLGPFECGGTYDLQFREHGRGFKIDVWFGRDEVNPRTRRNTVDFLNSLELDAGPGTRGGPEIKEFDASLVSPTAVRVRYRLSRPAHLALGIEGTKRWSPSGTIPFDAAGSFPDPTEVPSLSAHRRGKARIHFERGEFNFSGASRLRFRLQATTRNGLRTHSDVVTLNRDGLFGRKNVQQAIDSVDR